jgi:hypothetical protein
VIIIPKKSHKKFVRVVVVDAIAILNGDLQNKKEFVLEGFNPVSDRLCPFFFNVIYCKLHAFRAEELSGEILFLWFYLLRNDQAIYFAPFTFNNIQCICCSFRVW